MDVYHRYTLLRLTLCNKFRGGMVILLTTLSILAQFFQVSVKAGGAGGNDDQIQISFSWRVITSVQLPLAFTDTHFFPQCTLVHITFEGKHCIK